MKLTSKKLAHLDSGNFEPKTLADLSDFKGAFKEKAQKGAKWQPLVPGDVIDIVAPGSACSMQELRLGVRVLSDWGFVPRVPKGLLDPGPLFSNSDENRFLHLKNAFQAADSKVVWCLRGGYGSNRLLPELDKMTKPKQTKYLIGYSDITSIHSFVQRKWKWPSLHGPLIERLGSGDHPKSDLLRLKRVVTGQQDVLVFKNLIALNRKAREFGTLVSSVVGGNLCVLDSSIGTPWQFDCKDKILFLEEIGEKPHRVDRFFVHLEQSGALKGCKAILLGNFLIESPNLHRMIWSRVIPEFAERMKIPVFRGLPVGHGKKQRALPFGTAVKLAKGTGGVKLTCSVGVAE
ncbi:MAG: LD-carboxypeptidase [Bdellovibrionales bacterium]|nr:LD-carboxypeptidase [Bdellovibrionales bacterium]